MIEQEKRTSDKKARELLSLLSGYAKERGLSNRKLAEELGIPYNTVRHWLFFTQCKDADEPSPKSMERIAEFLESKEIPEVYNQRLEARHRAYKVRLLLLLLEDELRWFRDSALMPREEFRRELDAYDIGYISSLLTMLTEEDKFQRWVALTTARFNSFEKRRQ